MKQQHLKVLSIIILSVLVLSLFRAIYKHHLLMLSLWIAMPVLRLIFEHIDDLQIELKKILSIIFIFVAVSISLFQLGSPNHLRQSFAKSYVPGYEIRLSHDCEDLAEQSPNGDIIGKVPYVCRVENLDGVSVYWRIVLNLEEWISLLAIILIPLLTIFPIPKKSKSVKTNYLRTKHEAEVKKIIENKKEPVETQKTNQSKTDSKGSYVDCDFDDTIPF